MVEQAGNEQLQAGILQTAAEVCAVDMDVVIHESVDSTNSWSLQQTRAGKNLPFACFTEEQTQGRGRRGKDWIMAASSNIAMSVAWPFSLSHQSLQLLPLSVALVIVETLESFDLKQVRVKWPNDVYVQGKKIAGVLIETQPLKRTAKDEQHVAVVIGVGVNYDMSSLGDSELPDFTDVIDEIKAQAVADIPCRSVVASSLLAGIVALCQNFQESSKQYLERYRARYDYCKAKHVELLLDNKEVLSGIAQGVNEEAELLVMVDGEIRAFNSAEVSVRAGKGPVAQ